MDLHTHLTDLYRYHQWRVGKFTDLFGTLPAEALALPIAGSFASLSTLLSHLIGAEDLWHQRIATGHSPTAPPAYPTHSWHDYAHTWQEVSHRWLPLLAQEGAQGLQRTITYSRLDGTQHTDVLAELLVHIADHCTYHSGQVVAALRQLHLPVVGTSFLFYLRARG